MVDHHILGKDNKATVVADVERMVFSAKSLSVFLPLDTDGNSGVHAFAGAEPNAFASGQKAVVSGHGNPCRSPIGTEQPEVYYFLSARAKGARTVFAPDVVRALFPKGCLSAGLFKTTSLLS